jgi:hypothetical protein
MVRTGHRRTAAAREHADEQPKGQRITAPSGHPGTPRDSQPRPAPRTGPTGPRIQSPSTHLTSVGHLISTKRVYRLMKAAELQGRHHRRRRERGAGSDRPAVHHRRAEHQMVRRHHLHEDARRLGVPATVIDLHSWALVGWARCAPPLWTWWTLPSPSTISARRST